MPAIVLLAVAMYVAVCLFRPMRPFTSRRQAAIYGLPAVAALAVALSLLPPPESPPPEPQAPPPPSAPTGLSATQEEMRLNKLRGQTESSMEQELRDAARR